MSPVSLKIVLAAGVGVWLLVCLLLHERFKEAAWLAGSTVASCLFFLGATVAAGFLVQRGGPLFLAPLGVGVLALALLHLRAAQRRSGQEGLRSGKGPRQEASSPFPAEGEGPTI